MAYREISPESEPLKSGESWWIINPNNGYCEFSAPQGCYARCTKRFQDFMPDVMYEITGNEPNCGWISLRVFEDVYRMPYYVFARYFDSEAFVKNRSIHHQYPAVGRPRDIFYKG